MNTATLSPKAPVKYECSQFAYYCPAPRMTCPDCKGIGVVWPRQYHSAERCRQCNGQGLVHVLAEA
jgi:DnaJ-class molecular chaperone